MNPLVTRNGPMSNANATVDVDRDAVNAVLEKLGVEKPEELMAERAMRKLTNRLTKRGVPAGLSPAERAVVEGLGFTVPADPPPAAPPATPKLAKGKMKFRLPGIPGVSADRVEEITPDMAATRNRARKDERRWEPVADDAEPAVDTTAATPKENDVATATATKKGTTKKAAGATPPAAKTKAAGAGAAKTNPDAANTAPKKTPAKTRTGTGAKIFMDAFADGKPVDKAKLIEKMVKAGVKEGTATAYCVWAKRPMSLVVNGVKKNPFGFRITETKDDKGHKILTKVTKGK